MKRFFSILTIMALITSSGTKETEAIKEEEHKQEAPSNEIPITDLQMKTARIEL